MKQLPSTPVHTHLPTYVSALWPLQHDGVLEEEEGIVKDQPEGPHEHNEIDDLYKWTQDLSFDEFDQTDIDTLDYVTT